METKRNYLKELTGALNTNSSLCWFAKLDEEVQQYVLALLDFPENNQLATRFYSAVDEFNSAFNRG